MSFESTHDKSLTTLTLPEQQPWTLEVLTNHVYSLVNTGKASRIHIFCENRHFPVGFRQVFMEKTTPREFRGYRAAEYYFENGSLVRISHSKYLEGDTHHFNNYTHLIQVIVHQNKEDFNFFTKLATKPLLVTLMKRDPLSSHL